MTRRCISRWSVLLLAGATIAQPVWSGALKVAPIRVVLDTHDNVQVMRIENEGQTVTRVQLRLFDWSQPNGEDDLVPTRDVLANPAMFEIAPGQSQIARIGLRVPPGAVEKSYRLLVDEVPGDAAPKPGEIRSLLRISIPVFVPSSTAQAATANLRWRASPNGAGGLALVLQNTGSAHIKIRGISVHAAQGGAPMGASSQMLYLLPGSTRRIGIAMATAIRTGQRFEMRVATDGPDIVAPLPVEEAADAEHRN